jgi:GSH-dependent disulfide-bond oxidoreductase
MIDLHYWPTPNGKKITIMLEETELQYRIFPVNINKGDQFKPEFLEISPNNKMPAIVDRDVPSADGKGLALFESGAILVYLAEKTGKLLPADAPGRYRTLQWVFWQMAGLGPMAGQAHHFLRYAPQKVEYAMHRYKTEVARLYKVLDTQLGKHEYIAGDYSIADIAAWPWVARYELQEQDLDSFPGVKRWFEAVGARPAVRRGSAVGEDLSAKAPAPTDEDKKRLFGFRDADLK